MSSEQNSTIALTLLDKIQEEVQKKLGSTPAIFYKENYDSSLGLFCERMIKECENAEKKAPDNPDVKLNSLLIKAKLYGHWQKPIGGLQHKKAIECYEEALKLAKNNKELEAKVRFIYGVAGRILGVSKEKNISNLQRVIELTGLESDMGRESAKLIEKEKNRKKNGCFIATAVYGDEFSEEVILLKSFRDQFLLTTNYGKVLVKFYYFISPFLSKIIANKITIRNILKKYLFNPTFPHIASNFIVYNTVFKNLALQILLRY